jgi:hypothetical protein
MWFFGAVFLAEFPSFAKDVLHGDERVASLLLVVFSVGIGIGSLLCEVLSRRHVEIGLVPLGAIGMSVFAIDLYFASRALPPSAGYTLSAFMAQPPHWRVMADLGLLSLFAGPLQRADVRVDPDALAAEPPARIIAANNILNALFMIASSLIVGVLIKLGLTVPQVFLVVGLLNAVVAFYIFMLVPEYLLRFFAFVTARWSIASRCRTTSGSRHRRGDPGLQPRQLHRPGAADGGEPAADRLHHGPPDLPHAAARLVLQLAKAIPIAPQKVDPRPTRRRSPRPRGARRGDLLCIFPEGAITRTGEMGEFKGGVMKLLESNPVPVIPARPAQPLGLVLLARRRPGDGRAVPPRPLQPGRAVRRASRWRRPR